MNRNLPFLQFGKDDFRSERQLRSDNPQGRTLAIENQLGGNGHRDSDRAGVGAKAFPVGDRSIRGRM
ncbi:uncharacterized protein METZ01_LOCUS187045 [marine metagenome]|uniref:Uncharacterized protein n=1 Tax=marine metagenome TaxID=408172 RepID=A0A382D941_9ZZZZ